MTTDRANSLSFADASVRVVGSPCEHRRGSYRYVARSGSLSRSFSLGSIYPSTPTDPTDEIDCGGEYILLPFGHCVTSSIIRSSPESPLLQQLAATASGVLQWVRPSVRPSDERLTGQHRRNDCCLPSPDKTDEACVATPFMQLLAPVIAL